MPQQKAEKLAPFGTITTEDIVKVGKYKTPAYIYDDVFREERCKQFLSMPNAFGLVVRYAMKANTNATIVRRNSEAGLHIDASSLNEVRRAYRTRVPYEKIMLTTQEVPRGEDREELEEMILRGLRYNACSMEQLRLITPFVSAREKPISVRLHPGEGGSGESLTRDTANPYSCFGIHLSEFDRALRYALENNVIVDGVHVHIGSGAKPEKWKANINRVLEIILGHVNLLPNLKKVNFGGGFKEARMPDEEAANIEDLGLYAKEKLEEFSKKTGEQLVMEVEPGTYIMANSGYIVTQIMDIKKTGPEGFQFYVADGGLEVNPRVLFYASRHPFYLVSKEGKLLFSDFADTDNDSLKFWIPVGRCCESGDAQSQKDVVNENGEPERRIIPRRMGQAEIGDYFVIGGAGAYCKEMAPANYNSHTKPPELIKEKDGSISLLRKPETLEQVVQNEVYMPNFLN